jgi:hypothetical protein
MAGRRSRYGRQYRDSTMPGRMEGYMSITPKQQEVRLVSSEFIMGATGSVETVSSPTHGHLDPRNLLDSEKVSLSKKSSGTTNTRVDQVYYDDADLISDSKAGIAGEHKRVGVDLERWWLASALWQRLIPFMLLVLLLITIAQLVTAIICFVGVPAELAQVEDPYVCRTQACRVVANNLKSSINPTADPCTNFYEFGCGNYNNPDESPDAIPLLIDLARALMIYSDSQEAFISR